MPEINRRPGWAPGNAAYRHRAIGCAEILAIGKKMRVSIKVSSRRAISRCIFDLLINRIGIDQNPDRATQMLFAQLCCAAEIDDAVGFGVERLYALTGKSVIGVTGRVPIGPSVSKAV